MFLAPVLSGARPVEEREVQPQPQQPPVAAAESSGETATVDYYGDLMTQRKGDTVLYLVDHVVFHHNGTYIQCDSAKRYDDYRIECFGNVLINKDSTYIYGDWARYDGHIETASIYSPLLKLVNGDATMWVFNHMDFNTRTNIGEYNEGAVIVQRDNRMESDRGIFNGDSSTITFVGHVALRNDNYKIRTDSISYNFDNEVVTFLSKAYIWDRDRDFLTSDRGTYVRATETYHFTREAYAMTEDQEFWADTMDYESAMRRVVMRRNIQVLDTVQRAIGLGDFGFYNDSLKNGMLTDDPAVILYDAPDTVFSDANTVGGDTTAVAADTLSAEPVRTMTIEPGDSAFARADTILFETYGPGRSKPRPAATKVVAVDTTRSAVPADSVVLPPADSVAGPQQPGKDTVSLRAAADSVVLPPADSVAGSQQPGKDTLERVIRGRHNVRLWQVDGQGVCDSLTAYTVDSMAMLFGRPLIWNGSSQLSADRIDLYSRDGELDYAEFIGEPFITQQVEQADTLFNQAQGRLLQAWFRNNEVQRAIMTGNVLNYYYMGDEGLPPDKFAVISCGSLTIDFENREPSRIKWGEQGNEHIDPIDRIPAGQSQRLPGFSWEPERKPRDRYDITDRSVRPSIRRVAEGYAQPVFPIERRFEEAYRSLLEKGGWRDRTERLDGARVANLQSRELLY